MYYLIEYLFEDFNNAEHWFHCLCMIYSEKSSSKKICLIFWTTTATEANLLLQASIVLHQMFHNYYTLIVNVMDHKIQCRQDNFNFQRSIVLTYFTRIINQSLIRSTPAPVFPFLQFVFKRDIIFNQASLMKLNSIIYWLVSNLEFCANSEKNKRWSDWPLSYFCNL